MSWLRLVLICSIAWGVWTLPAKAATFFDTDFELGGTTCNWAANGWIDFGQAPCGGPMSISTASAFTGTHALRLDYVTDNNTQCVTPCPSIYNSASDTPPFPARDHVFFRWAIKVTSGFQISVNNTKQIILGGTEYPRPIVSLNSGVYQLRVEGPFDHVAGNNADFILSTNTAPRRDQWDQVEMEWKMNTCGQSDGLARMWVNNVLKMETLNRQWRGNGTNVSGALSSCARTITGMQFYLQNGVGTIYYDRVAAGDTRIGLVGTIPQPQDTTPPATPTGFAVGQP